MLVPRTTKQYLPDGIEMTEAICRSTLKPVDVEYNRKWAAPSHMLSPAEILKLMDFHSTFFLSFR